MKEEVKAKVQAMLEAGGMKVRAVAPAPPKAVKSKPKEEGKDRV